jgi:hypothetical protein
MNMSLSIECPNGHRVEARAEDAGERIRCPKCQAVVRIPGPTGAPPRAAARGPIDWKRRVVLGGGLSALAIAAVAGYILLTSGKKPTGAPRETPANPARDRDDVEAAARGFMKAAKEGDRESMLSLMTEKARQRTREEGGIRFVGKTSPGTTYQLGNPTITEDTAHVPGIMREVGSEGQFTLKLRRDAGHWRVYEMTVRVIKDDPDSELPFNFEDPEELGEQIFGKPGDFARDMEKEFHRNLVEGIGKPDSDDVATEALEGMDQRTFDATWKDDLEVEDRPAGEALRTLAERMGLKVETTPAQDRALARHITLALQGRSRWELIEEVCRQVGFYPVYSEPGHISSLELIRLKQRPRPRPVAFAGPFLVELDELQEFVPHATGMLTVKVSALGLPAGVAKSLHQSEKPVWTLAEVVDDQGRDLSDPDGANLYLSGFGKTDPYGYNYSWIVPVRNLLRDVAVIDTLRGRLHVPLPARVETLRFATTAPGAVQQAGDIEMTLRSANRQQQDFDGTVFDENTFDFEFKGAQGSRVNFVAYDARGQLLQTSKNSWSGSNNEGLAQITVSGQPASVVAKVIAELQEAEYEFRMEDIPLPSHAKMPEKLEPAMFPGHEVPVTVEFVKLGEKDIGRDVQLRVTNHADKDIRVIELKFEYLDAEGKVVGEWSHNKLMRTPGSETNPIVVAKHATTVSEVQAPFIPDETERVGVTVLRVGFIDATQWVAVVGTEK